MIPPAGTYVLTITQCTGKRRNALEMFRKTEMFDHFGNSLANLHTVILEVIGMIIISSKSVLSSDKLSFPFLSKMRDMFLQ